MFISTDKTCHKFSLVNLINFARYGCIDKLLAHVTVPNRQCLACSNRKTQMAIVGYLCHIKVEKLILIHIWFLCCAIFPASSNVCLKFALLIVTQESLDAELYPYHSMLHLAIGTNKDHKAKLIPPSSSNTVVK